jgi:hypothetical protein
MKYVGAVKHGSSQGERGDREEADDAYGSDDPAERTAMRKARLAVTNQVRNQPTAC